MLLRKIEKFIFFFHMEKWKEGEREHYQDSGLLEY